MRVASKLLTRSTFSITPPVALLAAHAHSGKVALRECPSRFDKQEVFDVQPSDFIIERSMKLQFLPEDHLEDVRLRHVTCTIFAQNLL